MNWKDLLREHFSLEGDTLPRMEAFISTEIIEKLLTEVESFNSHGRFISEQLRKEWLI